MKKIIYLLFAITIIISACNTTKKVERGNWDNAINTSVRKLKNNKGDVAEIQALQTAYPEATAEDNLEIQKLMTQEKNWGKIYNIYQRMNSRQEKVFSVLPLTLNGKQVTFNKVDYKSKMQEAKENAGKYHYHIACDYANKGEKKDFQYAFKQLNIAMEYLGRLDSLLDFQDYCYQNGIYRIIIRCHSTIPFVTTRMLKDVEQKVSLNTPGTWVKYYYSDNRPSNLDFTLEIDLRNFLLESPKEEVLDKKFINNGNTCDYHQVSQISSSRLIYSLDYRYLGSIRSYYQPHVEELFYEFVNIYASYRGSFRAVPDDLKIFLENRRIQMPSKNEMLAYSIRELRDRLPEMLIAFEENILSL